MLNKNNLIEANLDNIKKEYKIRIDLLLKILQHIDYLCSEHIISINENSRCMKILNDIIKVLNILYNNAVKTIKYDEKIDDDVNINTDDNKKYDKKKYDNFINNESIKVILKKIKNFDNKTQKIFLGNMLDFYNIGGNTQNSLKFSYFSEIDDMIKELINMVGCSDICDIIRLYNKLPVDILFSNDELQISLLELLKQCFVPLFYNLNDNIEDNVSNNFIELTKVSTSKKYEILLDNFYNVKIQMVDENKNKYIVVDIKGFFKNDSINIVSRSSQIFNKLISKKKRDFYSNLSDKKKRSVPYDFRNLHIKNLTIGEILSNDENSYNTLLAQEYGLFQKYSGSNFRHLFEEFTKMNLEGKFKMIKILLFGNMYDNIKNNNTEDCMSQYLNNAGLLYGCVKESKIGTSIISDIILKNLNYSSRLKLAKSNSNMKHEINKINTIDSDDIDFKQRLFTNPNMPDKVKKLVNIKISEMKSGNSEYYKHRTYVETLIDFPWTGKNDSDIFTMYNHDNYKKREIILSIKERLNEKVYGHRDCKETIVELMGKWFSNPKSLGKAIGLHGPPGVGKTLIARELGKALDIPFTQINLGGMEDGSILAGHSITYSGAVPGLIIKNMVDAGKSRCIMFMDELDKTAFRHGRNEITDILIHVIDQTSNSEFTDKFFQEIKFPINKVLFIFSFNDKDKIDKILLDRMEILTVGSYSIEDKTNIINDFLMKELKEEFGFNDYEIIIEKEEAEYLIENFTLEAGVRNIRRKLEKIFSKLNMDRLMETGPFEKETKKIIITRELIDKYINKSNIINKKVHTVPKIGNVNGLYATSIGVGGVIPILIYRNHSNNGRFKLELTGKQGTVMKESVKFAFTIAINLVKNIYRKDFKIKFRHGLHIHTPDGATAKDGPSAGSAFTLGFLSVILGKKIKQNIGLTGEIEQDGNITAIGGLEFKLPGAKKAGINLVFVPKENEKDIEKLKETNKKLFEDGFEVMIVEHIKEILDYALIESNVVYSDKNYKEKLFDHTKYLSLDLNEVIIKKSESYNTVDTCDTCHNKNINNLSSENSEENLDDNLDEKSDKSNSENKDSESSSDDEDKR
jgi:endopeptidase La